MYVCMYVGVRGGDPRNGKSRTAELNQELKRRVIAWVAGRGKSRTAERNQELKKNPKGGLYAHTQTLQG
jgi:hypothetical protein